MRIAPCGGSTVDIPNFLQKDDVFLNLIDRPKVIVKTNPAASPILIQHYQFLDKRVVKQVVALLELLVGLGGITTEERTPQGSPYNGVASVGGFQARTVPAENNEEGYIGWHRDKPPVPATFSEFH